MNTFLLQFEEENVQERKKSCSRFVVQVLKRERKLLLSRFPAIWTVGS